MRRIKTRTNYKETVPNQNKSVFIKTLLTWFKKNLAVIHDLNPLILAEVIIQITSEAIFIKVKMREWSIILKGIGGNDIVVSYENIYDTLTQD